MADDLRTTMRGVATKIAVLLVFATLAVACRSAPGRSFAELDYPEGIPPVKTLQVGTAQVAYIDVGQGERTLVLIHGLGSYMPVWKHNLAALAQDYRVVAIDLPGFGKSTKSNYAYSMAFFTQVIRGVVRELDIANPTLVGHSMGGQIALTYALTYPEDVEALVLASPAGLETFEDGEAKWLANAVTPDFTCKASTEAIYVRTVQNFYKMPKDAAFMIDDRTAVIGGSDFAAYCQAVSRAVAAMLDEPVYDKIPQIRVPTLVLFGKHDELIPNPFLHGGSTERLAEKAIKRFPQAELVVLDKAGHMAQFEQPQAWNEAVLAFLARDPAPVQTGAAPRDDEDATEQVEPLYAPGTDPDAQPTDAPPAPVEPKSAPKVEPAPVEPTPAEPEAVPEPDSPPELEGSGE